MKQHALAFICFAVLFVLGCALTALAFKLGDGRFVANFDNIVNATGLIGVMLALGTPIVALWYSAYALCDAVDKHPTKL